MALLECRGVSFKYPDSEKRKGFFLSDVEFSLESGGALLLYGRSGSGKSTLMRLLKPEVAPHGELRGDILFNERSLSSISERESAAAIGYVGQDPDAAPVTDRVMDELAFLPSNLGMTANEIYRRIAEISAFFGIEPLMDKKLSELSGGQKQLVNLAAVMTAEPELLLLDEPAAQLDPLAAQQFYQTVRRIRSELGTSLIISEHSAEHFFSDLGSVLYLDNGVQRFCEPPYRAAATIRSVDKSMLAGFPCTVRLSSEVMGCRPMSDASEGRRFVEERYSAFAEKAPFSHNSEVCGHKGRAVSVRGAYYRYGRYSPDVISGIDFDADFGSCTAVCGANGTGKSTLLRLISGILHPQEGRIYIDGKRLESYKDGSLYRGLLTCLPQNPADIMLEETLRTELEKAPDGTERTDEEINEIMDALSLDRKLLAAHPLDLSGGELQRAALAKLLLTKPKIILLDEPSKGIDHDCRQRLSQILRRFAEQGAAVIFITHDLDFAARTADNIALMFGGRIAASEPAEEFMSGGRLYTTAAARIGGSVFPYAITPEKLITCCLNAEKEMGHEL